MAAIGFVSVVFVALVLVASLALYWVVSAEEPDDERGESWNEARRRTRNEDDR